VHDLFPHPTSGPQLPQDGHLSYYPLAFDPSAADELVRHLLEQIPWRNDEVILFGKRIQTARQTAWFGDQPFEYVYSRIPRIAQAWLPVLLRIKHHIEALSATRYNCCLLNLYHDGSQGMAWHSDDEPTMDPDAPIASVSLGAERRFCFRHKKLPSLKTQITLGHGSLLIMHPPTQAHWLHALPKSTPVTSPRINLTFRSFRLPSQG
jgi:alkylated DNA repair dioxygenase AlkB